MLIDSAKIYIKSGSGGNGAVSFHREKYVAAGGPDGGDGGKGGDVIFVVDESMRTLLDFRYKKHHKAQNGQDGMASNMYGRGGEDLVIKIPPGTLVKDEETGRIIADLTEPGQQVIAAKGGKGGKGNAKFATSTRQVPRFAESGDPGEERWVILELKLIADVGLIGYPNVGKSTLLSNVSAARPKIADYHFTTLEPNLGVVSLGGGDSFVVADIPGLIEGAHAGVGLGHEFLKHVERTKVLLHVVDIAGVEGRDPLQDFKVINEELRKYNEELASRYQVAAANKIDIPEAAERYEEFEKFVRNSGYEVFPISAATGKGLKELMYHISQKLKELPDVHLAAPAGDQEVVYTAEEEAPFEVRREGKAFVVEGKWAQKLVGSTNFGDWESLQYFQRALRRKGVIDELEKLGIQEGNTVKMYGIEFEYQK